MDNLSIRDKQSDFEIRYRIVNPYVSFVLVSFSNGWQNIH
jgi:hypothetical protein